MPRDIVVEVVKYTEEGERLVAAAAKLSLSRKPFTVNWEKMSREETEEWIRETLRRGHMSPWEHSVYTWIVEGCSRICSHQLVRHRIASYTQYSQRFKRMKPEMLEPVVPPSIDKKPGAREEFLRVYKSAVEAYQKLINMGIKAEDARYILPQAVRTRIIVTMNAREIMHFLGLRMCSRAQWEIRLVAWKLWRKLVKLHPLLFRYAGPRCLQAENLNREKPLSLQEFVDGKSVSIERCPENVPSREIPRCVIAGLKEIAEISGEELASVLQDHYTE